MRFSLRAGDATIFKKSHHHLKQKIARVAAALAFAQQMFALQVAAWCCTYYHLRAQQIFMLQKFTYLRLSVTCKFVPEEEVKITPQLAMQHFLREKLQKMLPLLLSLKHEDAL